jgi:DNA-binding GntR family transcriptional regulator
MTYEASTVDGLGGDRENEAGDGLGALRPLRRPEPVRHQVQSALRELIITRTYEPGQHLVESEVARRLRVSRLPVREALQALHLEGWLDLHVGRGAFVHVPTSREVNEVFAVRGSLEEEATRLTTPRITADGVGHLRQICGEGRASLAAGDFQAVVAANARFHRAISDLADNAVLSDFLGALEQRVRWYFRPLVSGRGTSSWDEHEEIIEALAVGRAEVAGALMRQHTENTRAAYNTNSTHDCER